MRAVIFYRISSFEHGRCVTDKIYAYELVMYYLLLLFIPDFYMFRCNRSYICDDLLILKLAS